MAFRLNASVEMEQYFDEIDLRIKKAYQLCTKAREKGYDPELRVDIPIAKGISERVEGLISAVAPQILGSGVAKRINQLEKEYGSLDWRVALKIAEEVAKQKFCKFSSPLKAIETGIRVGLSYITLGVISAPLEGFIELKAKKTKEGKEYFSVFFAGPIRAAGGTAEAVSLIITDYVRIRMGYEPYDPTEAEIKRAVTEIHDYHERITNLQYHPSDEEIEFLVSHLPVEVNGDPTEKLEVSNYKDLPRIETNRLRGGLCLVIAEGLAQKAPKLNKQLKKWGKSFDLDWAWVSDFLEIQKRIKAKTKKKEGEEQQISPNYTYIKDLVAGRPILSHPMKEGGLRLRYGRSRLTGLAASAMHPATQVILNDYIATGTQLKVERPGKAAAIVPCDSIDGPIVKLKTGQVLMLNSKKEAKQYFADIEKILFLGDILTNYGDFSENGHKLVPAGYCQEWWIKDFERAAVDLFGTIDMDKLSELTNVKKNHLSMLFKNPIKSKITYRLAKTLSNKMDIPLHPDFLYYWKLLKKEELLALASWLKQGKIIEEEGKIKKIVMSFPEKGKQYLERIGLAHLLVNNEFVVVENAEAEVLADIIIKNTAFDEITQQVLDSCADGLDLLGVLVPEKQKDKCGTFIGTRMGRPEKAKMRKLTGSPHGLFPVGEEGGRLRCIQSALEARKIEAEFTVYKCKKCNKETIFSVCETCREKTQMLFFCEKCGTLEKPCEKHGSKSYKKQAIDIGYYFKKMLEKLNTKIYPDLIKGVKGTSNKNHVPEHLIKGILRAKHGIYVNKDGTTRYDMIELPVTHFKPNELTTSIEKLKEIGYTKDIDGKELTDEEQVLEILPQDMILPDCPDSPDELCSDVLFSITKFIDELLVKLYGVEPYYGLKTKADLAGQLVIGL
ncbi:DNA polymerase II large subunit, partial [Candidatus Woesearchaeota archaeon]|nr:DNA polymerase II large subunit [Candidatus Woesearchaeota archaeon]